MESRGLPSSPRYEVATFNGTAVTAGTNWQVWSKPAGKTMATFLLIGAGGGGGAGAIGANSAAAGGGGGGAGGVFLFTIPLVFVPNKLYISVGASKTGAGLATNVCYNPNTASAFATATGGAVGGNASGATAGAAGTGGSYNAGAINTFIFGTPISTIPGTAGSTDALAGASVTLSEVGGHTTGGAGGGALGGSGTIGVNASGAGILVPAFTSYFRDVPGGSGGSAPTSPPEVGIHGTSYNDKAGFYYYGGTGGGATHGSATGAGLVQARGGNGGIGSGGGGSGGALTGSTAAPLSMGGPGMVVITCY